MGVMRRNLFLMGALMAFLAAPALAEVTVEQTTDAEYLYNQGYSQSLTEDVFMQKGRVNGHPIEPLYEKSQNIFVKGWRWFNSYVDPAYEQYDLLHHDIKTKDSFSDL